MCILTFKSDWPLISNEWEFPGLANWSPSLELWKSCAILSIPTLCMTLKIRSKNHYRFPCDPQRRDAWIREIGLKDWIPNDFSRIWCHCYKTFFHSSLIAIRRQNKRHHAFVPYVTIPNVTIPHITILNICNNPEREKSSIGTLSCLNLTFGQGSPS
jgi:hypothetical protein